MMTTRNEGKTVFIAGSRGLSRLSAEVRQRLDNIIDKGLAVVVGDANGVDKAVQRYLSSRRYPNVAVFCMDGHCRNNVGQWPTRDISAANSSRRDFNYYSTKDRAMVEEADYGLMLWDGESRGTLRSVLDLVKHTKPTIVYVAPLKSFYSLRHPDELADMLARVNPAALGGIDSELKAFVMAGGSSPKSDNSRLF